MNDWHRNLMAFLEAKALDEEHKAQAHANKGEFFQAGVSQIIATNARGWATEVEEAWQKERERDA